VAAKQIPATVGMTPPIIGYHLPAPLARVKLLKVADALLSWRFSNDINYITDREEVANVLMLRHIGDQLLP
jgi:hypothetical protein